MHELCEMVWRVMVALRGACLEAGGMRRGWHRYPQLAALHTRIIPRARAAPPTPAHDCTTDSANKFICTQIVSALAIKTLLALELR